MTAPIIKVSQLAAASALTGTEAVPVVQGGVTKKTTTGDLIPIPVQKFVFDTSNTTPPAVGELAWNADDATLDAGLPGGVLYPHPTIAGRMTNGAHTIDLPVAMVLFAGNNGSLFVRR